MMKMAKREFQLTNKMNKLVGGSISLNKELEDLFNGQNDQNENLSAASESQSCCTCVVFR